MWRSDRSENTIMLPDGSVWRKEFGTTLPVPTQTQANAAPLYHPLDCSTFHHIYNVYNVYNVNNR